MRRLLATLSDDGPFGRTLALVVVSAAWAGTWRPQLDPDAWWHLAFGDDILRRLDVPRVESFSWLSAGEPVVAHSWLWDVGMAAAYSVDGETGTSLLGVVVAGLIVGQLWWLLRLVAPSMPPLASAGLVLTVVLSTLPLWAPRAGLWDIAFSLSVTLAMSFFWRTGSRRALVVLPIVGIAWANLHGSGVLALPVQLALALVAEPIGVRWGVWPRRPRSAPLAAMAVALMGLTVNPYGPALLAYPFDPAVASALSPAIAEWHAPEFDSPSLLGLRVLLSATLVLAIGLRSVRPDPYALLLAGAWTFAALGAVRFAGLAAPMLVVALAPAIGPAVRAWLGRETSSSGVDPLPTDRRPGGAVVVGTLAIASIVAAGWLLIAPAQQAAAIGHRFPVDAAATLASGACPGRLVAAYGWGGYVIRFVGRAVGAYGNSPARAVADQAAMEAMSVDPRTWLDEHDVQVVLMPTGIALDRWLDEADEWVVSQRDPTATIHARIGVDCSS